LFVSATILVNKAEYIKHPNDGVWVLTESAGNIENTQGRTDEGVDRHISRLPRAFVITYSYRPSRCERLMTSRAPCPSWHTQFTGTRRRYDVVFTGQYSSDSDLARPSNSNRLSPTISQSSTQLINWHLTARLAR